jgi:release factor glutamine methyltransferase
MSKPIDWTVLGILEWGTSYFEERDVPSPRLSIEWLLADILKVKRLDLYVQFDRPLNQEALNQLRSMVKRRASHEPLQYITGSTSFYNIVVVVNSSVLIPRPETEELVELILNENQHEQLNVIDIGTGSGCIPIAISHERPKWNVVGIDICDAALQTAKENDKRNHTTVNFQNGDLFTPENLPAGKWDIIVSNPPYIHEIEREGMDKQVKEFEPKLALFCKDRTMVYKSLKDYAEMTLKSTGKLYLEIHEDHPIEDENIFDKTHWNFKIERDLNHKRRFVIASRI